MLASWYSRPTLDTRYSTLGTQRAPSLSTGDPHASAAAPGKWQRVSDWRPAAPPDDKSVTFANQRADDQKRERQQQQTQQQQTHRLDQLIRWEGVAKVMQEAIRADSSLSRAQWPCMRLYLTGKCGADACKSCSKSDKGRGDDDVRACASKRLAELIKKGAMSSDLASEVAKGERARA